MNSTQCEYKFVRSCGSVVFARYVDRLRILNVVTVEALEDFFGADDSRDRKDILQAFKRNQDVLLNLAVLANGDGFPVGSRGGYISSEWLRGRGFHEI